MAITTPESSTSFLGDGTNTVFAINFPVPEKNTLVVRAIEPNGSAHDYTLGTDYDVRIITDSLGFYVAAELTLTVPLPAGWTMGVTRILPILQEDSLNNQGGAYPSTIEKALDHLTMIDQQQANQLQKQADEVAGYSDQIAQANATANAANATAGNAEVKAEEAIQIANDAKDAVEDKANKEHAATHLTSSTDPIPLATPTLDGLMPATIFEVVRRMRRPLTGPATYYIAKSGNDANNGLAPETAFLTFARLKRELASIDGAGYGVNVLIYDGTWNETLLIDQSMAFGIPNFYIAPAGTGPVIIDAGGPYANCIVILKVNGVNLSNLKVQNGANGIYLESAQAIITGAFEFGEMLGPHIKTDRSSLRIYSGTIYTISGGAGSHIYSDQKSTVYLDAVTANIAGAPQIHAFATVTDSGSIFASGFTYTGDATNITYRYFVGMNGLISTNGGGENYFPGQVSYSDAASGGIYV